MDRIRAILKGKLLAKVKVERSVKLYVITRMRCSEKVSLHIKKSLIYGYVLDIRSKTVKTHLSVANGIPTLWQFLCILKMKMGKY